ncbi:hypothetical protein [Paenibacillus sp. NPDC057934]|uniref:DUF7662 domain-containing protein n=1 Tax=Paenibacillus sp. NPDC057934 TaxID=3346282 RepID=UPI0036DF138B
MSKYFRLEDYLKHQIEVQMSYSEIEKVLGDKLPESSYTDRTWWANTLHPSRTQAHSWLNAGWKIKSVDLGNSVIFVRNEAE